MGVLRKFELQGGNLVLILDPEQAPIRYHGSSRIEEPTATLLITRGSVTQKDAAKAATRVMRSKVTVTTTRLELRTMSKVSGWQDAMVYVETFVEELDNLLRARVRATQQRRVRGAGRRQQAVEFVNRP